jgi:hypothetical protein
MKTRIFPLAAFGILLALGSTWASAQDLGALARASREKKMKVMQERSVRIYSNENMPRRPAGEGQTAAAGMSVAPPSPPAADAGENPPPGAAGTPEATADDQAKTKEYWQGRFKSLRQRLVALTEQQLLAEDELSLLQVQQARELSPDSQGQLETQAKAASAAVEARRQETNKVKKELEELEKEFKVSGTPAEWSKTD